MSSSNCFSVILFIFLHQQTPAPVEPGLRELRFNPDIFLPANAVVSLIFNDWFIMTGLPLVIREISNSGGHQHLAGCTFYINLRLARHKNSSSEEGGWCVGLQWPWLVVLGVPAVTASQLNNSKLGFSTTSTDARICSGSNRM